MVKVKAISRDKRDFAPGAIAPSELKRVQRSTAPEVHPFERGREYVRALNAVKLDKHFSKPFVTALDAHMDGVYCIAKSAASLSTLVSGACDGEIIRWDLTDREVAWRVKAHTGFVRGVAFSRTGHHFVSASDDKTYAFTDIDHHHKEHSFATGGPTLLLWDTSRTEPIQSFEWGADSLTKVRFNPAQHNLVGALSNDRSVSLFDLRTGSAMQKAVMQTRANALCWNPQEPMHFTLASEDSNLYTFDMRRLHAALTVHKDHVGAVLSVDYSPTGRQFVSGSYDRSIRIWNVGGKKSETCYHTKRMQRVFSTCWSPDNQYLVSGSDDTNLRLWRSKANERPEPLLPREKKKREYEEALIEKHKYLPAITRIKKHQHLPKGLMKQAKVKETVQATITKREKNRRAHSAPGKVPKVADRKKKIWRVEE